MRGAAGETPGCSGRFVLAPPASPEAAPSRVGPRRDSPRAGAEGGTAGGTARPRLPPLRLLCEGSGAFAGTHSGCGGS